MYKMIVIAAAMLCAASANALTYEWTDRAGVVHFTDSPENIPPAYLKHVIIKDDIIVRDPRIREELRQDEERAQHEESTPISRNVVEPAPTPAPAPAASVQTLPEDKALKPDASSPVWNLCAPGQPLTVACAPGPLKKKGG